MLPEFYEKNLSDRMNGLDSEKDMLHPDVIVVDPPRKGCDEKCLETMLKMQPKRIVYVSCDSATLARDLKYLCENGYRVYCSEFDEIKQEVLFERKIRCIGEIIYRIKKSKYTKEVVLLGVGKGAAYAEVLSSKMPETIRTMILYSPEFTDELYGDEFQEECYQEDKMYYVSKFTGPVLIIQGEKDKVAEMKTSEKLLNCYDTAQLNVLPGRLDEGPFWIRKRAADLSSEFIKKLKL